MTFCHKTSSGTPSEGVRLREIQGKFNKESFRINSDLKECAGGQDKRSRAFDSYESANRKYFEEKKENTIPTAESLILAQDER